MRPGIVVPRPNLRFPLLLRRAPPSVRLTYACLHLGMGHDGPSVSEASGLPERTVRHAVRWLVDEGLVRRVADLQDTRRAFLVPTGAPQWTADVAPEAVVA